MKNFLLGVLAAVMATVLGYLAIEGFKEASSAQAELTIAEFDPTFVFGSEKAKAWEANVKPLGLQSFDSDQRLMATAITIKNTGSASLQDQRVVIKPKFSDDDYAAGVVAFQNDAVPGIVGDDTIMSIENKTLTITYKLLDVNEMHRFWIVHDRYSALDFVARTPGLEVSSWDAKIFLREEPEDWSFYWFAGFLVAMIGVFFLGLFLADKNFKSLVSAQGISYKKLIDDGIKARAENARTEPD